MAVGSWLRRMAGTRLSKIARTGFKAIRDERFEPANGVALEPSRQSAKFLRACAANDVRLAHRPSRSRSVRGVEDFELPFVSGGQFRRPARTSGSDRSCDLAGLRLDAFVDCIGAGGARERRAA